MACKQSAAHHHVCACFLPAQLSKLAKEHFGSGWAWLCLSGQGDRTSLQTVDTLNQDNPLMKVIEADCIPIMGIDVWEHRCAATGQRTQQLTAYRWKITGCIACRAAG